MTWTTANSTPANAQSNLADKSSPSTFHSEVGTGGMEITGGKLIADGVREVQMYEEASPSSDIMATVRAAGGSQIMNRAPIPSDTIDIGGTRVSLQVAANMGFVTRNPDGSFTAPSAPVTLKDPTAEAKAQAEIKEAAKAEPTGVSFGEAGDAAMADLMKGQNGSDLFKTVDSVLHRGEPDEATIGRMASMAGVEPSEMEAQVATVWQGAYDAASEFMADAGVGDEDAFEAFMNDNPMMKANMLEAARNYFVHHKTEGLQTMADAYVAAMDKYDTAGVKEMLEDAGWSYQDKPGGGLQVIVNGAAVSWDVAVKQKVITFSKA